jgi:hypothetical protein
VLDTAISIHTQQQGNTQQDNTQDQTMGVPTPRPKRHTAQHDTHITHHSTAAAAAAPAHHQSLSLYLTSGRSPLALLQFIA